MSDPFQNTYLDNFSNYYATAKIDYHTFTLNNASKVLNSLDAFFNSLEFNGLDSLIQMGNRDISNDTVEIKFTSHGDKGSFVQIWGFMVNTESMMACLGINGNNDFYIPMFDFQQFLEVNLFGEPLGLLSKDDMKYLIEAFKLDPKGFNIKQYLDSVTKGTGGDHLKFGSVILNYVNESINDDVDLGDDNGFMTYKDLNNDLIFEIIANLSASLNKGVEVLIEAIFGNISPEKSIEDVIANAKLPLDKLNVDRYSKSFENQYLRAISEKGVDSNFARELSSSVIGIKNKMKYLNSTENIRRNLAMVSCGAYVSNKKTIDDSDLRTQNLIDLLKSSNHDEDLLFSYDVMESMNNKSLMQGLIKKLDIDREVKTIGMDNFTKSIKNYTQDVLYKVERGELDTKLVDRSGYTTVTIKSLNSVGRIFEKVSKRLQAKFK